MTIHATHDDRDREHAAEEGDASHKGPTQEHDGGEHHGVARGDLARIALVAVAVAVSWFFRWQPVGRVNIVALVATLVGGYPIFKEAFEALRDLQPRRRVPRGRAHPLS